MEHSFSQNSFDAYWGLQRDGSCWRCYRPAVVSACAKPQTQQSRATTRGQWNSCSLS